MNKDKNLYKSVKLYSEPAKQEAGTMGPAAHPGTIEEPAGPASESIRGLNQTIKSLNSSGYKNDSKEVRQILSLIDKLKKG